MKRAAFAAGALVFALPAGVRAASGPSTIVAVRCDNPELDEQAEDALAGRLRELRVNAVDPSAIDSTDHKQSRVAVTMLLDAVAVDYSSIGWVTHVYHARRLLVAQARLISQSLPYGEFTVFNVRARCSYRAFDVRTKQIVAAGSLAETGRDEDRQAAQENALQAAMTALAERAAAELTA